MNQDWAYKLKEMTKELHRLRAENFLLKSYLKKELNKSKSEIKELIFDD
jgi:hypothetical protein